MSVLHLEEVLDRDRFAFLPAQTPHKSRRWLTKPRVALIHATAGGTAEGTLDWFEHPTSRVSADIVIDKGGRIWRPVPRGWYSWHAGTCTFHNELRTDYNRFSFGIELVNWNNGIDVYPQVQRRALAFVIAMLKVESPSLTYVRRHCDVAYPRGRKTDPKGLTVTQIHEAIREYQPALWLE